MNALNSIQTTMANTHIARNNPSIQPITQPVQPLPQEPSFSDIYDKLSIEQQHNLKREVEDTVTEKKEDIAGNVQSAWQADVAKAQYKQQVNTIEAYMNSASTEEGSESGQSNSLTLSYLDYQQDAMSFKADVVKAKNEYKGFDIESLIEQQTQIQGNMTKGYQKSLYESGELLNLTV